jgi:hypothetical protein
LTPPAEVRLDFYRAGNDQKLLSEGRAKTERLQNQLWADGVAVGEKDPRAVTTGLFLQPLNEMIDPRPATPGLDQGKSAADDRSAG